jgi:hypothetical protein
VKEGRTTTEVERGVQLKEKNNRKPLDKTLKAWYN